MTNASALTRLRWQLKRLTEQDVSLSPHRTIPTEQRFDRIRSELRNWLQHRLGPLDRPWLILGSAPKPTLPSVIPRDWLFVCINNAPLTADMLGLRPADLVIRTTAQTWDEIAGLSARATLLITTAPLRKVRKLQPRSLEFAAGSLRTIKKKDRNLYLAQFLAWPGELSSEAERPSNGVLGLAVALECGASEAIAAGISLSKHGHSYNSTGATRLHVATDGRALATMAEDPRFATTEEDLALSLGIRLVTVPAS